MQKDIRKVIDSGKARYIATLTVSGLMLLLVFFLTDEVMDHAIKNTEKQYFKSCSQVVEGYSSAIHYYLENYHTALNSIYNEEIFSRGKVKEIHDWIVFSKDYSHEDFCTTFYIDEKYTGYFSQGGIADLYDKPYLQKEELSKNNYYVSDIYYSQYTDEPVFIIEEPYIDKGGKLKGVLCASIKLEKLKTITDKIKIGENSSVYLQDRNGRFLIHPSEKYIGEIFVPKQEKYKNISSVLTSKLEDRMIETENENGETIDLFSTKIENCGWTLAVGFPKSYLKNIYSQHNKTKVLVLIISVAALFIFLFLEMYILEKFYHSQLVKTSHDTLTNLWTRQKFEKEATKILRRNPKAKFMLIESDIRGFKFLNQNYGGENADRIIFFYSTLLNKITTKHKGIISRGYADHFYSLLKIKSVRNSMKIFNEEMNYVLDEIRKFDIPFFPKYGITFLRPEGRENITIQELISQASFAKSTIKDNMLTQFAIYNSHSIDKANEERYMELGMSRALEQHEFFVVYQPKVSLKTDKIVGAEALVRWKTPDRGIINPDAFVPLFERNGFIKKLDFYVYEEVFKFLSEQIKAGNKVVPISVNMSRNHDKPERFMHDFMLLFKKYNIPSGLIQVEIIERSVMNSSTLKDITEHLHKEGFTVAMDDFGSGESSLNMLTQVPVDVLKFDREFLLTSTNESGSLDEKSARFIQILIDLSKHLDKQTVFEGVETQAQRDFLKSIECDLAQGYFYSRPLSEKDFLKFLEVHG
mgnify:FL=1